MIAKKDLATFSGDDAHNMNEDKIYYIKVEPWVVKF
nr:hypothetical protein Iba_chr05cCG12150 [Ipomoea batatas]